MLRRAPALENDLDKRVNKMEILSTDDPTPHRVMEVFVFMDALQWQVLSSPGGRFSFVAVDIKLVNISATLY